MKIMLDAGHGYDTPGKRSPDGMREYEFNRAVAAYAKGLLDGYQNVAVYFAHSDQTDVPLQQRTNSANNLDVDIYVSIHANASGSTWSNARGIETYVYPSRTPGSVAIATKIQNHLINRTGLLNRGVKTADFHVLRETNMDAVLIECGFMTNQEEVKLLRSESYRRTCAEAIVAALAEQYGLKKKATSAPAPASVKAPSVVYEAHIQGVGWQGARADGQTAGTTGKGLRLEALTIRLKNTDAKLSIEGHVENKGWTSSRTDGEVIGTVGEELRLEAIKIKCNKHNILYRVHIQDKGWTGWAKNGEVAGTTGKSKRIEAIEIKLA